MPLLKSVASPGRYARCGGSGRRSWRRFLADTAVVSRGSYMQSFWSTPRGDGGFAASFAPCDVHQTFSSLPFFTSTRGRSSASWRRRIGLAVQLAGVGGLPV